MKKDKKEKLFYFVYPTKEDKEREKQETIANLKEEQKTDFIFNDEVLYYLGRGHSFGQGFYKEHITKSGIKATFDESSETWNIDNKIYKYENNDFIDITPEPVEYKPIDWSKPLNFPMVKNIKNSTIGSELKSYITSRKWKK